MPGTIRQVRLSHKNIFHIVRVEFFIRHATDTPNTLCGYILTAKHTIYGSATSGGIHEIVEPDTCGRKPVFGPCIMPLLDQIH